MDSAFKHTQFYDVFFPPAEAGSSDTGLTLRRKLRFSIKEDTIVNTIPHVFFDFETTGLEPTIDRVIEIGAIKTVGEKVVGEFSTLVKVDAEISKVIQNLTGITPEMLQNQPRIDDALPKLLEFMEGAVLVAHNADFDTAFLQMECSRMGIDIEWPAYCTLKMARDLLRELERKNLDSLANHYNLTFESRHRSIGDVKVTIDVMNHMIANEGSHLKTWKDYQKYHSKFN